MKLFMFSIYDKVAHVFDKPFVAVNHQTAIRAYENALGDNQNLIDYDLYVIGEFDDQTGDIRETCNVEKIKSGLEVAGAKEIRKIGEEQEQRKHEEKMALMRTNKYNFIVWN